MWFATLPKARLRSSLALMALLWLLSGNILLKGVKPVRKVLIINEVGTAWPAIRLVDQEIREALDNSPYELEFYGEYMDTFLFPDPADQERFQEFYVRKYHNHQPDVIITVGPSPLRFMAKVHKTAFPGVPIVFCYPNWGTGSPSLGSDFTGIENDLAPFETIEAALRLQPGTRHIIVIGGTSLNNTTMEDEVKEKLKRYEAGLDVSYLTTLAMPDLLERLRHLPAQTIVLYTNLTRDVAGSYFTDSNASALTAGAANSPVFSLTDLNTGHGEVGGKLSSASLQSRLVGELVLRILKGEKPREIPKANPGTQYIFDWRALKRWGMKESNLPPGSIVLNRQVTLWESYKWYIIAGISLVLLESALLVALMWQRARRRRIERELALTNDRLRMAIEAGKSVGWETDERSGTFRLYGDLQNMFGIPGDSYNGVFEEFRLRIYPEDRQGIDSALAEAKQNRGGYATEFRVVRPDGNMRWVTAKGRLYFARNGEPERMLGIATDITERKQIEVALRASENKLAGIVASAMDAIITIDDEQQIVLFNAAAEKMFGCVANETIGTTINRFIPQRFRSAHKTHILRFGTSGVTNRAMGASELWAVRANGQEFPIEASISNIVAADGIRLFTVIIRDITGRKEAEEFLHSLSGQLIEAQEEERRRIAREIHDDIQQRVAMLAVDLDTLAHNVDNGGNGTSRRLVELWDFASQLGADLHSLSHRLHSSTLDNLGLAEAVRALCEEFEDHYKIEVSFIAGNVPRNIQGEGALCLFRVAQEALQNVRKHSHAERAEVCVEGLTDKIHLSVCDGGKGFDPSTGPRQGGIGIRSIEQRLRLVNGQFAIRSSPTEGTRIDAWVPI